MKKNKITTVLGVCLTVSMLASACASKKEGTESESFKKTTGGSSEVVEMTDDSKADSKETSKKTSKTTKDTDSTTDSKTETEKEKEKEAGDETLWELDDSLKFEDHIPAYTSEELETEKKKKLTLYTAQIGDGCESVIPALKEDAWIQSLGSVTDYYKEAGECAKGDGESPWRFHYSIGLLAAAPSDKGSAGLYSGNPFEVQYQYNTVQFTGAFFVSVRFAKLDFSDPAVQENVFRVVKSVYGEELGTVLLYGKETDAAKAQKKPNNMNVSVKKDGMNVRFTRTAMDLGEANASLYFCIDMNPGKAPSIYYQGDYSPIAENFGGLPNEVLGGDIGNENILDPATFANKFYNGSSEASESSVKYTYERWISQDGREAYNMEFDLNNLHLAYGVGMVNKEADSYSVGTYGDTCDFPATSENGVVNDEQMVELNRRLEVLSGVKQNITIDQLEQAKNNKAHYNGRVRLTFIIMGNNFEKNYIISADGNAHGTNVGHWRVE
ncbi:MAG: hypothetical protein IKD90_06930 [Clostridiales bacterium]|nr:hypothetical protein [Clostridiales bacterium]